MDRQRFRVAADPTEWLGLYIDGPLRPVFLNQSWCLGAKLALTQRRGANWARRLHASLSLHYLVLKNSPVIALLGVDNNAKQIKNPWSMLPK
jgi:hypothetical protein